MSGLTKKTAKPKTRKPAKQAQVAVQTLETPVLFRLPDLSNLPEPTPAASIGVTTDAKPMLTSDPIVIADAGSDSKSAPKPSAAGGFPKLASQSLAAAKRTLVPAAKTALTVAGRAVVMPYVAPAGLLAASLLITLGVIYGPFGGNKPAPESQPQANSAEAPTIIAKAEKPTEDSKQSSAVASEKRQLKKIANELDEQLLTQATNEAANEAMEEETDDVNIANAEASLPPGDDESGTESFTEPWSRKKPTRTVAVAKAEMDSDEDEGSLEDNRRQVARRASDEVTEVEEDEEVAEAPPKKTAPRSRQSRTALEEEWEEQEETPAPKKQYKSRYAEEDSLEDLAARPEATDKQLAAEQTEGGEEPISPWKRIRNERLEREPKREAPIAKRGAPQSKGNGEYRSPAGQDIELDPEWFDETASRPRGETKRTSPR